jgi:hypothetical protein
MPGPEIRMKNVVTRGDQVLVVLVRTASRDLILLGTAETFDTGHIYRSSLHKNTTMLGHVSYCVPY